MIVDEHAIKALFDRCLKAGEAAAKGPREQALLNEAFVHGKQTGSMVHRSGVSSYRADDWFDEEELPRVFVNKLMSLRMTWVALMNKSRISAVAYPASDDPEDTYRAESSNRAIRFMASEEDTASKVQTMVAYGCDHGTAALKIVFDAEDEKIRWSALSIFDFVIDPTPSFADAKWCIFERWMCAEEAEAEWESAGLTGAPPTKMRELGGVRVEDQTQCFELWHKPTRKYPRGCYAFFVGGRLVERTDFPYFKADESGKDQFTLPIFVFKVRNVRGSAYGGTNMSDCIPIQRTVNELNARLLSVQRKMSGVHAWLPKGTPEDWDPAVDSRLYYEEGKGGEKPMFLQNLEPSPLITTQRDYFEAQLPGLMALNERTTGDQTTSVSGVALETTIQLDADKNADASKSLENVVLNAIKFQLDLMGAFYTTPRKMRILDGDAIDVASFVGQDTIGVDVRLEVGSELDQRSDVRGAQAEAKMQAGLATSLDVQRAKDAPNVGFSRRVVQAMIRDFLAGVTIDPKPGVDFDIGVFDAELAKAKSRALADGNKADWVALHRLAEQVAAMDDGAEAAPKNDETATAGAPAEGPQ